MIGLDIRVEAKVSNYLYRILEGVNFKEYDWYIYADEALNKVNGEDRNFLFESDELCGEDFLECISRQYYMIFINIKAYPAGSQTSVIKTFEDFIKSDCELVLMCYDTAYLEFYCKNRAILDKVYRNCCGNDFVKVEYRTASELVGRDIYSW